MGSLESSECRRCCCTDEADGELRHKVPEWKPRMTVGMDEIPSPSNVVSVSTPMVHASWGTADDVAVPTSTPDWNADFNEVAPLPVPDYAPAGQKHVEQVPFYAPEGSKVAADSSVNAHDEEPIRPLPDVSAANVPIEAKSNDAAVSDQSPSTAVEANVKDSVGPSSNREGERAIRRFFIEILREGPHWDRLGLLVSPDDDPSYLVIDGLSSTSTPSLISTWNQNAPEEMQVREGQKIVSVNGHRGCSEKMMDAIMSTGQGQHMSLEIEVEFAESGQDELIF